MWGPQETHLGAFPEPLPLLVLAQCDPCVPTRVGTYKQVLLAGKQFSLACELLVHEALSTRE